MNSFFPAEGVYPQNYIAEQQRLQISEVQFGKFQTPSSCLHWKIKIQNPSKFVFRFSSDAMLWIKEVEMVDSADELNIIAIKCRWLRVAGDWVALKEDKEFAISGKQKVSVREETNAVSDTRVMIVQNQHQKPLHPLSHQHQEVEVRREKEGSEAEVSLGSPTDSRAKTS